jgi:hypothetical protein
MQKKKARTETIHPGFNLLKQVPSDMPVWPVPDRRVRAIVRLDREE